LLHLHWLLLYRVRARIRRTDRHVDNNKLTQHWNWIAFSSSFSPNPIAIIPYVPRWEMIKFGVLLSLSQHWELAQYGEEVATSEQDRHTSARQRHSCFATTVIFISDWHKASLLAVTGLWICRLYCGESWGVYLTHKIEIVCVYVSRIYTHRFGPHLACLFLLNQEEIFRKVKKKKMWKIALSSSPGKWYFCRSETKSDITMAPSPKLFVVGGGGEDNRSKVKNTGKKTVLGSIPRYNAFVCSGVEIAGAKVTTPNSVLLLTPTDDFESRDNFFPVIFKYTYQMIIPTLRFRVIKIDYFYRCKLLTILPAVTLGTQPFVYIGLWNFIYSFFALLSQDNMKLLQRVMRHGVFNLVKASVNCTHRLPYQ
jgi:hypothetical protein